MTYLAYFNGKFINIEDVKFSPFDRGVLFGESVYEVIPVFNYQAFHLHEHILRLYEACKFLEIELTTSINDFTNIIKTLIESYNTSEQIIYIQITSGCEQNRTHLPSKSLNPTVFAYSYEYPLKKIYNMQQGVHCSTYPDMRWQQCFIKTSNLIANTMAAKYANNIHPNGQAILIKNNYVTESTSSNIFVKIKNKIITPPIDHIVRGVTRAIIIKLLKKLNIEIVEENISKSELLNADEVWLTGSIKQIVPVLSIDNKLINNGITGKTYKLIKKYYYQQIANESNLGNQNELKFWQETHCLS